MKRKAMVWCNSMDIYSLAVFQGRVAFVFCPIVNGKFCMKVFHKIIAISFGKHRSGSDGQVSAVAFYDTMMWNSAFVFEPVAIDQ